MKKFFVILFGLLFCAVAISDTSSWTIHIIGDSTVCNYKGSAYPQTGWGQVLSYFFDNTKVKINNVAIGGRSSKTFIQEGRLANLKSAVQKGDFIFVQFGHNDRYFGTNSRQVPIDSFGYYMQQYIDSAFAWGATPVLVSPMNMNTGARNIFTEYDARGVMLSLAEKNKIPFVDLNMKSYEAYNSLNSTYVSRFLFKTLDANEYPNYPDGVQDGTTHFQEMGSLMHADFITDDLKDELSSASYLSNTSKTELAKLVSVLKPKYKITIKSNNNSKSLITESQNLPAGTPFTLRVLEQNGETFEYFADDDCNILSKDKIYYGFQTPERNITYTAMFQGGASCEKTPHETLESSSSLESVSSSSAVEQLNSSASQGNFCTELVGNTFWKSPVDIIFPDVAEGTTDTNHIGFTGQGFFNIENSDTSKAVFKMYSEQSASNAKLLIRYSNGTTENRKMKITVDANSYEVDFLPTSDWDTWDSVIIENVWLDAVPFDLVFESLTENGGPNIDKIAFDIANVYRETCLPAKTEYETSFRSALNNIKIVSFQNNVLKMNLENIPFNVQIFDLIGKSVLSSENSYIDLSNFKKGFYIVKVLAAKKSFVKTIQVR